MISKETPSCCKTNTCFYNALAPPEESHECLDCPYLIDKNWQPSEPGQE